MKCKHCGCTETQACEGGCWWVAPEVCSSCEALDRVLTRFHMRPATKSASVIRVLLDGPATTREVVAETGLHFRLAGTHLANLFKSEKLTRTEYLRTRGGQVAYLWRLKDVA